MPTPIPTESAPVTPKLTLGRILVVEDEDLIRDTIALTLSDEGYEVITVADGRQALEHLQFAVRGDRANEVSLPDLIILDLMLPFVNGLDICRWMRREGSSVPILMLSAKDSEMDRVVGLEVGADDYLTKPFGKRELVARCRALLRRHQHFQPTQAEPTLQFQEVIIYPQECRVTVRGEVVNFSPKEFKLLELFLRHPKRVWSRDQLLEKIWGHDFIGESKTVDVHIRWLREKLEIDPSSPQYLVTVRGFGYRFG
ncbi:MAG: response regulator transcription factor [Leptolyngbya sp. Prado105]|nr:response regulator transcription factor [Leptolyngbya sp. Prado105]